MASRYSMWYNGGVRIEGNNGGDYVLFDRFREKDQTVHLEIGHCCVVMVDHRVPVELITSVFSELVIQEGGVEGIAEKYLRYNDEEWAESRRQLVRKYKAKYLEERDGG